MTDEWQTEVLDLQAYLQRVGGPVGATAVASPQTLGLLQRAHLRHIPFENADVILGRPISVDLADIQTKLVTAGRGGYCYEHNLLFAAVLERLGYRVARRLARVGDNPGRPRPRTHLALDVTDEAGGRWMADVGFGSGPLHPIPLKPGADAHEGAWHYRLSGDDQTGWRLDLHEHGRWTTQYIIDTQPQHLADIVMANHYTQTWPTSPFRQQLVVVRKDETSTTRLLGRHLEINRPHQAGRERILRDDEIADTLLTLDLALPDHLLRAIVHTLPPAHAPGCQWRRPHDTT